jgi:hypothetical protein
VRATGDARGRDEFSRIVVKELAKLVPADQVVLNEVDLESRRAYVAGRWRVEVGRAQSDWFLEPAK